MTTLTSRFGAVLALLVLFIGLVACSTAPTTTTADETTTQELRSFNDSERLPIGDSPVRGNPEAPIVIVEFISLQCPYCARGSETVRELLEKYPDQIQVVFKHMPLEFQPQSRDASRVAEAARRQGAFWEVQDALLVRMNELGTLGALGLGTEIVSELGLDVEQFHADLADPSINSAINADLALAQEVGVKGTPNFFVNGFNIQGAQPLHVFEEVINLAAAHLAELDEQGIPAERHYAASVELFIETQVEADRLVAEEAVPPAEAQLVEVHEEDLVYGETEDYLVTLVEFSSLQCPFCQRASLTLGQIRDQYGDKVRFVFKHNPLAFHEMSVPAARALIAAERQDHGTEMLALLYANQSRFAEEGLFDYLADIIGLDMEQFTEDFNATQTLAQIESNLAQAEELGVRGTPHFFINGIAAIGAQPYTHFAEIIEDQIRKAETLQEEEGVSGEELYRALVDGN